MSAAAAKRPEDGNNYVIRPSYKQKYVKPSHTQLVVVLRAVAALFRVKRALQVCRYRHVSLAAFFCVFAGSPFPLYETL
jgi:hypothetical protein